MVGFSSLNLKISKEVKGFPSRFGLEAELGFLLDFSSLERSTVIKKMFNIFILFLLTIIPEKISSLIFNRSPRYKEVKQKAKTSSALEIVYQSKTLEREFSIKYFITNFFANINNSRAVRNRFVLVEELTRQILRDPHVTRILSIGSGSSGALINSLSGRDGQPDTKIFFFDKRSEFSEIIKNKIRHFSPGLNTIWAHGSLTSFLSAHSGASFDLIEMVGLLDYFEDARAVSVINEVYRILKPGSYFIAGNISFNLESLFLAKKMNWQMKYRSPGELHSLLSSSNFCESEIYFFQEPFKIHTLALLKK